MESPIGTALTNIFVRFQEARLFEITNMPFFYKRHLDEIFVFFSPGQKVHTFSIQSINYILRWLSPVKSSTKACLFLDVSVEPKNFGLQTSIYRKPSFTDRKQAGGSFCSLKRKINLINTLVHRAKSKLAEVTQFYRDDFVEEWISLRM